MFVLIISHGYPTNKWPLNGIFEFDQAKALKKLGHEVIFISIDLRSLRRWRKWGISHLILNRIEIYNVSIPLGRLPWRILYFFGKLGILCLYKKISNRNRRPDIIHAHFNWIGAIASVLKKKYNLPIVITEHNSNLQKIVLDKNTYSQGNRAYKNADRIISVSKSLSKKIKQHFGFNSIVIHNMVDTSYFKYKRKEDSIRFIFISVGDLIYRKGHDLLIEAFNQANFRNDVFLYIIGEGPLYFQLQNRIIALGLHEHIKLLGLMNRCEIGKIMQKCDAFVLASRAETFGVVFIEAMLAGLPVIATICGGPEEFIDKQTGILIPSESVEHLKKAMIDMYGNKNIYNREQISLNCLQKFSPDVIALKISKVYYEALRTKSIS